MPRNQTTESRFFDQNRFVLFQIFLNGTNPAQTDWNAFLVLIESVMRKSFANFHDFNMNIVHFPKLALDQRSDSAFYLHRIPVGLHVTETSPFCNRIEFGSGKANAGRIQVS